MIKTAEILMQSGFEEISRLVPEILVGKAFQGYSGLLHDYLLKKFLRSRGERTSESLNQAMTSAVNYTTGNNPLNWFNHCGLFT